MKRGSSYGHLSRRSRPLLVIETRMTDLQFLDELIELPLEFLVAGSREDSLLPCFGQVTPIDAIQLGIVELLLTRVHDLVESCPVSEGGMGPSTQFVLRDPNPHGSL